ncbi:MAG: RNA 2',3'-cyclic phosphodiesterase [Solirubrobacteraceae bacterium]
MSHPGTARLFIALDLPDALRHDLAAWARRSLGTSGASPSARAIAPASMHLTLCFLGTVQLARLASLAAIVEGVSPPASLLSLGAPLWLPPRRPRALAVEVRDDAGGLAGLHDHLLRSVHELGMLDGRSDRGRGRTRGPRSRPFRPHITVARMKPTAVPADRSLPATPSRTFGACHVVLYRSHLEPAGARYEALAESSPEGSLRSGAAHG